MLNLRNLCVSVLEEVIPGDDIRKIPKEMTTSVEYNIPCVIGWIE